MKLGALEVLHFMLHASMVLILTRLLKLSNDFDELLSSNMQNHLSRSHKLDFRT